MPNLLTSRIARWTLLALLIWAGQAAAGTLGPMLRGLQAQQEARKAGPVLQLQYSRLIAVETSPAATDDPTVGVILTLEGALPDLSHVRGVRVGSVHGTLATARLPLSSVAALAGTDGVVHVQAARMMQPALDAAVPATNADEVWAGAPAYTGDGVLVGVIDSGIDWRHPDFDTPGGQTRIVAIWDLFDESGTPPAGFSIGSEWTATHIDAGTAAQVDLNGHGTHVAGTAAGNGQASGGLYRGVAHEADILFAKPWNDQQGGFPEDRTIDAMNYLVQKAQSLGQPIAINMSLGGHFGPHDGTRPQEQLIDQLSGEGVVFLVAAGNEGESFITDQTSAAGGSMTYRIVPYDEQPGAGNDIALVMIWVDGAGSPSVTVQGAGMTVGPIGPGESSGVAGAGGTVVIDNASSGADPLNGDKLILIQWDDQQGTAPAATDWTVSLSGGTGTAHAWHVSGSMVAGFPGTDNRRSVGMPATAEAAITVAAWKSRNSWPSIAGEAGYGSEGWGAVPIGARAPFSSIGPTRDGRQKPDISAPGMAIVAPYSQDTDPPQPDAARVAGGYYANQGTSMATPMVAGIVALMLEKEPALTAAEVKQILRDTAITDGQTGGVWNEFFGWGKIDAQAAVAAVGGGVAATGDIDADGQVSVLDLVLLVNHILDPVGSPLAGEARTAADVFPAPAGNGVLDAQDLARLVAFVLGTDAPGFAAPAGPVLAEVGVPVRDAAGWWLPVTLRGGGVMAGQFVVRHPDAHWDAGPLAIGHPDGATVGARVVGDQLRVMFFTLDEALLAGGLELRVPLGEVGSAAVAPVGEAALSGVLLAAAGGEAREVEIARVGGLGLGLTVAPNPARGATTIGLRAAAATRAEIAVYDLRGRRVRLLRDDAALAGAREIAWDGRGDDGRALPAGVYMVRVVTPRETVTAKVTLQR
jgi:subtilisin family serine protease